MNMNNTTYDLFVWKCRGAGNDHFRQTFLQFMKENKLEIMALI